MPFEIKPDYVTPGGGAVFVNPGSGPISGATKEHAQTNIGAFLWDLCDRGHEVGSGAGLTGGDSGRWAFTVTVDGLEHEVEMPGLPLAEVRYMGTPEQSIWDFPRLYVDGSSWVWKYALGEFEQSEDSND